MVQPAPACCVCLATSALAQGVYLILIVLCFVAFVVLDSEWARHADDAYQSVIFVTIFVTAIIMSASRICTPCCYEGLEKAGRCCPCSCFLHLDTPLHVMVGPLTFLETLAWFTEDEEVPLPPGLLRLVGLAAGLAYLASVICAIVKLCVMAQLCCQGCLPEVQSPLGGHVAISEPVIGQPMES